MFIDNEEELIDDVPETSEENKIETSASEGVEEVQEITEEVVQPSEEDIEKQIEERANKIAEEKMEARLIRDRIKREREEAQTRAKYEQLENIMKSALGADNIDDVIAKSKEFYKEQGISIPEIINKSSLNEREEMILAKADAVDIIKLGKSEMEVEANRIASIPEEKRSLRDKTIFNDVCKELVRINDEENFKAKGYDTKILNDKDFLSFREQFNLNIPVSSVYEMYSKLNVKHVEKPASAGSAKNEVGKVTESFSAERINNMTPQELMKHWNNPEFRRVAGLN